MTIFKKTGVQGNFVFSDGTSAIFQSGFYETDSESEISQLSKLYEIVESKEVESKDAEDAPVALPTTGKPVSSAQLKVITK